MDIPPITSDTTTLTFWGRIQRQGFTVALFESVQSYINQWTNPAPANLGNGRVTTAPPSTPPLVQRQQPNPPTYTPSDASLPPSYSSLFPAQAPSATYPAPIQQSPYQYPALQTTSAAAHTQISVVNPNPFPTSGQPQYAYPAATQQTPYQQPVQSLSLHVQPTYPQQWEIVVPAAFYTALHSAMLHLRRDQADLLIEIASFAMYYSNPQAAFNALVRNQEGGLWTSAKTPYLLALSSHLPTFNTLMPLLLQQIVDHSSSVCFYKRGITSFLGNFALCPNGITIWGQRFQCAEAAFQWCKLSLMGVRDPKMNQFFKANGEQAFELSRSLGRGSVPTGWDSLQPGQTVSLRDQTMWEILTAKFTQHPELMGYLHLTKTAFLLEHQIIQRGDTYWSDHADGTGQNRLGQLLEGIRQIDSSRLQGYTYQQEVWHYCSLAHQTLSYKIDD